jgi:hypothetical protein
MRVDILAGDIRDVALIAIFPFIEDDAPFDFWASPPKRLAPRNTPSSNGMLKRGSLEWLSFSVLDMS